MTANKEPLSDPIGFRLPASIYDQMTTVISQQLDPRVKRTSDAGRIGIELWLGSVDAYVARPEVKRYMRMREAVAAGNFLKEIVRQERELKELKWEVGDGQATRAFESAESNMAIFLREDFND